MFECSLPRGASCSIEFHLSYMYIFINICSLYFIHILWTFWETSSHKNTGEVEPNWPTSEVNLVFHGGALFFALLTPGKHVGAVASHLLTAPPLLGLCCLVVLCSVLLPCGCGHQTFYFQRRKWQHHPKEAEEGSTTQKRGGESSTTHKGEGESRQHPNEGRRHPEGGQGSTTHEGKAAPHQRRSGQEHHPEQHRPLGGEKAAPSRRRVRRWKHRHPKEGAGREQHHPTKGTRRQRYRTGESSTTQKEGGRKQAAPKRRRVDRSASHKRRKQRTAAPPKSARATHKGGGRTTTLLSFTIWPRMITDFTVVFFFFRIRETTRPIHFYIQTSSQDQRKPARRNNLTTPSRTCAGWRSVW